VITSRTILLTILGIASGTLIAACNPSASLPPSAAMNYPNQSSAANQPVPPPGMPSPTLMVGQNPWKPNAPPRKWKHIVIHHTATKAGSVDSIHETHLKNKDKNGNPWLGIGYHFVIGNGEGMTDGAIESTFRWRTQIQGAHAGSSNKDYNELGIGICLVGNFEKTPPTPAQKRSVKMLVQTLRREYGIPVSEVVGHKDIRASSTECPGKLFPVHEVAIGDSEQLLGLDQEGVPVVGIAAVHGKRSNPK
jgi:N-acetylmuramoyl-L-alanine amidase